MPRPSPGSSEVLVETAASLISAGTEKMVVDLAKKSTLGKVRARPDLARQVMDKIKTEGLRNTLEKVRTKLDTPIPLGYSGAGTVFEAGSRATIPVGTRVACGGAGIANHAEYNVVPPNLAVPIPEKVSFEDASFVTVGAIALQGVRQAAPAIGEKVGVIGLGLIGQLTVQILKANGCDVVGSDVDPWKLEIALAGGADVAVTPDDFVSVANALTGDKGLDAVIITASTQSDEPIRQAGLASRRKGRVISVGLTSLNVPRDLYYYKELELRLSHAYGPGRHDPLYEQEGIDYPFEYVRWTEQRNFEAFLRLVAAGSVQPGLLVTHRFSFPNALAAYELMTNGGEPYLAIVLTYPESAGDAVSDRTIEIASKATSAESEISLAIIGTGGFAKSVLLPRIAKAKDLRRIVAASRTGLSARHAAERFRFDAASTDYRETIARDDINCCIIATRHNTHAPLAVEAISRGKHVFVEKPLAINREQLNAFVEAYDGSTVLQVGFNRRFSSHAAVAHKAIGGRQGVLSYRINAGEIFRDSWIHDPEVGGGRIVGEVCHFVDFASFVLDAEPVSVTATRVADRSTHDDVSLAISFHNGSIATIVYLAKGNSRLSKEFVEVFADGTAVSIDNFRRTTVLTGVKRSVHKSRGQDKGFDQELQAFFESVREGESAIPFVSLVSTTKTTFAAVESLRTGRRVSV